MAILHRLAPWLRTPRDAEGDAAIGEAFAAVRDAATRLGLVSFHAGERSAQQRVEDICRLPHAFRFPQLVVDMVKDQHVSVEVAAAFLAEEAERADALAQLKVTEPPAPTQDDRAPTFH
jgi:hypothetical protein